MPSVPLLNNTIYTASISSAAESALGITLATRHVWSFTTIGTIPAVLSSVPVDLAARVAIDATVSVTFSELRDANTLTLAAFTLTAGSPAVAIPGTLSYDNATAVFTPALPLANNTTFTATLNTLAESALGVPLAANRVWTFTTIGTTPTVLANLPLDGATRVAVNGSISVTFSEAMDVSTLSQAAFNVTTGNPAVLVPGIFGYANSVAVFTPVPALANNTLVTVTVTTGAESALNVALAENIVWSFTTIGTTPTVLPGTPLNGATRVAIGDAVSATFSSVMDADSLTIATFTLAAAATPTDLIPGTVSYANATATFTPDAPLANGTPYTATINTGAMSSSGIPLAADRVWGFTTIHTTPTVLSELPAPLAANVAINSDISVTFSETMDAGTLNLGTFTLSDGAGLVLGTVSYAGSIAVFTPAAPLVNSTFYTVTVSTGAESANNVALATGHTWTFETIGTTPSIDFTDPADNVIIDRGDDISVTFNEAMNGATINQSRFTLTSGNPTVAVAGTVNYANLIATFVPDDRLTAGTEYTATLNTGAMSANDVPLPADYAWSFTTAPGATRVDLGTAGDFVILAQTAVTAVTTTTRVVGDIGISPAFSAAITGFSLLITNATDAYFLTSTLVSGKIFAVDNSAPTPVTVATAVGDMAVAFTDAASRTPDFTDAGANGDIGGMSLVAGVYKWTDSLAMTTNVTLDGNAADVWIFQIAQDVTMSSNVSVVLLGGALPTNVFWQVGGQVELGTLAHLKGIVLSQSAITLYTGATVKGRLLSQTSVTLHGDTVVNAGASGPGVNLGTAHDFAILAKTAISNVPDAAKYVTGNIGVSPIDSTAITGFNCVLDTLTGDYALSSLVIGKCFAADYTGTGLPTTPAKMTTAISDMETTFVDAAGRAPDATEL